MFLKLSFVQTMYVLEKEITGIVDIWIVLKKSFAAPRGKKRINMETM